MGFFASLRMTEGDWIPGQAQDDRIRLDSSRSLSVFGGLRMTDGWLGMTKWAVLAMLAAGLGLFSKGPGIVLVLALYPLFAWGAYRKYVLDSRLPAHNASHSDAGRRGNDREAGRDDRERHGNDKRGRIPCSRLARNGKG